jgi:signal transduction histidine kinase/DNA-binding response OmpR family regulator
MKSRAGPDAARQTPHAATLLATSPAGPGERRFALAAVVVSLVFFAVVVPQAKEPWPQVWAFIPLYAAALVVSDLITAVLLVGQYRIGRKPALLVLAAGYLFTALATVAHGLSFPGLFAAGGVLGGGAQTTAWLYMFWHGGFPLFVIAYVLMSSRSARRSGIAVPTGLAIAGAIFATAAVVGGLTLLATAGHDVLPAIMQGNRYTTAMKGVVSGVWLASLVALGLLWWRRPHSVLDLWLMVVLCAWLLDVALSAVLNGGRFDVGFYVGRAYGLGAATFVLGVLLLENSRLYAGLVDSHAQERARAAELRELSDRLEVVNGQLSDSNVQLQEQTRLKSEFLANMSHELRTPLNAVIGFSDMLKDGHADDPEKQRRFAGHIFQSGHHLLALVNDILDLSKIEAGKGELALGAVHVESAMAEAIAMLSGQAQTRQVRLRLDARGALGEMRADPRRLKQILLNLLSNALKFSPVAGTVTLRAEAVDRRRAESALPGYRDGVRKDLPQSGFERFVEISVSDDGVGITRADLDRLFTPFVQVPSAFNRGGEGTGLGLVMVHRLADLHGGTVAVTSEPGKGSCFTVWLPWRGEGSPDTSAAGPSAATRVALVVEDNIESAALVQAQLEEKGFTVRRVASAEAALALVGVFTPDLITLDILLPDMDGWEFLAALKATAWESVPVVVISVVADQGRGFSLGAALVLQKPIMRDALARGLERLGMVPDAERDVTVLVIDDDAAAVELLAEQLRQRDCVVLRALGGREGIELARRFRPDLITLDLEMPEVSGFDVVEALKGSASTAQIPIVVVTARDLSRLDREQLNDHVLDIVGKAEFNHGRFIGEVDRAMSRVG